MEPTDKNMADAEALAGSVYQFIQSAAPVVDKNIKFATVMTAVCAVVIMVGRSHGLTKRQLLTGFEKCVDADFDEDDKDGMVS